MATTDEEIGQNVARWRSQRMSQKDLADAMRARGWRWAQATVWSIEKGERPLRLSEAEDLAELLAVQISDLLGDEEVQEARRTFVRVFESEDRLREAIEENLDANDALHRYRRLHEGRSLPPAVDEPVGPGVLVKSPERIVREVRELREESARALAMHEGEVASSAGVPAVHDGEH